MSIDEVWSARLHAKKKARPSLALAGDEGINAYERLRVAVLGAEPIPSAGLATRRREGMTAWLKAAPTAPRPSAFHTRRASAASSCRRREERAHSPTRQPCRHAQRG